MSTLFPQKSSTFFKLFGFFMYVSPKSGFIQLRALLQYNADTLLTTSISVDNLSYWAGHTSATSEMESNQICRIISTLGLLVVVYIDGGLKQTAPGSLVRHAATNVGPDWKRLPLSFGLVMSGVSTQQCEVCVCLRCVSSFPVTL